jgi:hypothetical protein
MIAARIDRRNTLGLSLLAALTGLPLFAGFAGIVWELAQWAGYFAVLATLLLVGSEQRPRAPAGLLTTRLHSHIGWAALAAVAAHVIGLVLADRVTIEYFKPSAPLHQLAGIAAAALLLLSAVGADAAARGRVWPSHRSFVATHVWAACALTVLIAAHVIVTARFIGGPGRRALYAATAAAALWMLLRGGRQTRRFSVAVVVVAGIAALALLQFDRVDATLRESIVARTDPLPLDFPHDKHGAVNCLICHHNYADRRGKESCLPCHRSTRADLRLGVQARFHGFCVDCHRHPNAALREHGPVAGCSICHRAAGTAAKIDPGPRPQGFAGSG